MIRVRPPAVWPAAWPAAWITPLVGSRLNYWATFALDGVITSWFLWRGLSAEAAGAASALAMLSLGLLLWTLFEYLVHRHVFHGPTRAVARAHMEHHRAPRAPVGLPFFVPVAVALLWWQLAEQLLDGADAALLVAGSYAGYLCYGGVHHATHATRLRVAGLERRQRMHWVHHARHDRNFGVTTGVWDRLFGTHAASTPSPRGEARGRAGSAPEPGLPEPGFPG